MSHPPIPEHRRFSKDWRGEALFLVRSYFENDCAEIKLRKDWVRIVDLKDEEKENAAAIARCVWFDLSLKLPEVGISEGIENAHAWKEWSLK